MLKEERMRVENIFEEVNQQLSNIGGRQQIINPGSSEYTKINTKTPRHIIFTLQKTKDKKKIVKKARGVENTLQ